MNKKPQTLEEFFLANEWTPSFRERFLVWYRNEIKGWLAKRAMRYLKKRGWVVFYLEEEARTCRDDFCWLRLYQAEQDKK